MAPMVRRTWIITELALRCASYSRNYGNFDSRYVKDVRLGSQQYYGVNNWQTWNFQCPSGHVLSGINVQDTGSNSADNIAGVYYRPVQKYINGTWYNRSERLI